MSSHPDTAMRASVLSVQGSREMAAGLLSDNILPEQPFRRQPIFDDVPNLLLVGLQ